MNNLSIEIAVLISIVSVSVALFFGLKNNRRAERCEDQKDAADMTTVSVKLDFIRSDVSEIRTGMRGMQEESKDTRERLIAVEQSTKQAHKRIDQMAGYRGKPPDLEGDP